MYIKLNTPLQCRFVQPKIIDKLLKFLVHCCEFYLKKKTEYLFANRLCSCRNSLLYCTVIKSVIL